MKSMYSLGNKVKPTIYIRIKFTTSHVSACLLRIVPYYSKNQSIWFTNKENIQCISTHAKTNIFYTWYLPEQFAFYVQKTVRKGIKYKIFLKLKNSLQKFFWSISPSKFPPPTIFSLKNKYSIFNKYVKRSHMFSCNLLIL